MSYVLPVFKYIFVSHLDFTAFIFSLLAIYLSYYFWKNPIINERETPILYYDRGNKTTFAVRNKPNNWSVKKIDDNLNNISGTKMLTIATQKNNTRLITPPTTIEELQKLSYE